MKFCIIGLGRFGYRVATQLADNGMEVLGVDRTEDIIASIRDQITQAICMNVDDEDALRSIGVEEMDIVIVAMGENFAQSILVTALLKKRLNVPRVITRAISEIHKEILKLVGADQVILPEQEIGTRLADNLSLPYVQLLRLTTDFGISQIDAPKKFIGKSIGALNLFEEYGINCIGIKHDEEIAAIDMDYEINEGDRLIFAGNTERLAAIAKI